MCLLWFGIGNDQNCPAFGKKCKKCQKITILLLCVEPKVIVEKWRLWCEKTTTTEYGDSTSSDDGFVLHGAVEGRQENLKTARLQENSDFKDR